MDMVKEKSKVKSEKKYKYMLYVHDLDHTS